MMKLTNKLIPILFLNAALIVSGCGKTTQQPGSVEKNNSGVDTGFVIFLDQLDDAIQEFVNGNAEAFKSHWAHTEAITLSGGFGGEIEQGWEDISRRLDFVSSVYTVGDFDTERAAYNAGESIAYLVQHETIRHRVEDSEELAERFYRTTMIFKKINGFWKIVHRQADLHTQMQAPG